MNSYKTIFTLIVAALVGACSDDEKDKTDTIVVEQTVDYTHAIDLGLSVCWADMNLGAESEDELGNYYAWGEIQTKDTFVLDTYQHFDSVYIYIGTEIQATNYDAALMNWGGKWRMPTSDEVQELIDECEWQWEWGTSFSTFGYRVKGPNGNSIYLPAAGGYYKDSDPYTLWSINDFGYYWSGSLVSKGLATFMRFNHNKASVEINDVYKGLSIRPVVEL